MIAKAMFLLLMLLSSCSAGDLLAPQRANTYGDVLRTTGKSFAIVAPIAFGWSARPCAMWSPEKALRLGLHSARRWGGTSAGFSGGCALTQVVRNSDDVWCSVAGAGAAGLLGSPSIGQIPVRVVGFIAMSYALETQLLPRLQEATSAPGPSDRARPKTKKSQPPTAGGFVGGSWSLGSRAPWGSQTPWAEARFMKAVTRVDLARQAFEDRCVAWLLPEPVPR